MLSSPPCSPVPSSDDPVVRLREIDRAIGAIRKEQRLFRRCGFAESLKVMQIVALQMDQRECIASLEAEGRNMRRLGLAPVPRLIAAAGRLRGMRRLADACGPMAALAVMGLSRQARLALASLRRENAPGGSGRIVPRTRARRMVALSAETRIGA